MDLKERAYIINFYYDKTEHYNCEEDLEEVIMLSKTAGVEVALAENIFLREINPSYYITKGKLEIIKNNILTNNINVVIFNIDLKPSQMRNLEEFLECKVICRTELILDIFAQHARTSEAKIQVELAQLKYLLSMLTGYGVLLSRLGGGIGTRGPGETKLEYDRRHITRRISLLEKKLKNIEKHRQVITSNRKLKNVALVGYTNAGKTTLLNILAHQNLKTDDMLFVTLDPASRKVYLGENNKFAIFTDTVGFIKNLPHTLVASFKATLSEVKNADLVLHIVDVHDKNIEEKIEVVNKILFNELFLDPYKVHLVFNKIDKLENENIIKRLKEIYPNALFVSAKEKINIDNLKKFVLIKLEAKNEQEFR